jgi:hypothetical protein
VVEPVYQNTPAPIFDFMGPMPFTAIQGLFDPLLPSGLQWYWKGDFVKELSDAAIEVHLEQAAKAPTALSLMHLYPIVEFSQRPPAGMHRLSRCEVLFREP